MTERPDVDDWRVDVDDADEPVLVGTRDGRPFRSRPVAAIDLASHTARLVDGTMLHLGQPAEPVDPADPLKLPPAARQRRLDSARADLERLGRGKRPTASDLADAPLLEAWSIAERSGYAALFGNVTGHPRLPDGSWIHTSSLVWLCEHGTAARSFNRWYRLGRRLEAHLFEAEPPEH
ncbi:MAG: DUF6634 family protein [Alphaproteobacteria bacterium]